MYFPVMCVPAQSLTIRLHSGLWLVSVLDTGLMGTLPPCCCISQHAFWKEHDKSMLLMSVLHVCSSTFDWSRLASSSSIMQTGLRKGGASSRAMLLAVALKTPHSRTMCTAAPAAQVLCLQCVSAQEGRQYPDHRAVIHQHEHQLSSAACTAIRCCWLQL